jgi:hypothetical protein
MFELTLKNIHDILRKDAGCTSPVTSADEHIRQKIAATHEATAK